MRVKELMTSNAKTCGEDTDLATVANIMWVGDCGIVPVVNEARRLVGVVTDRDICIASATRAQSPANIRARDVMARDVSTCRQDDDVRTALAVLKDRRVRRLPVINGEEQVIGLLSISDLVARADHRRDADVPGDQLLDTLKAIGTHRAVAVGAR